MQKIIWSITALCGLFFILFLTRQSLLTAIGSFLIVQDEIKPVDVIVVLAGDNERVKEAARLYKRGEATHIIMSGGSVDPKINIAQIMKREAVRLGVPQENIILEPKAKHTYEHPIFVKPILHERGFKSAIVVSSPYHMRRSSMLFKRSFKKSGIELIFYPVQDSWFNIDQWWARDSSRKIVSLEYTKMTLNVFGVRVSRFVGRLMGRG